MQLLITKLIEYELGVKERTIYEVDNESLRRSKKKV